MAATQCQLVNAFGIVIAKWVGNFVDTGKLTGHLPRAGEHVVPSFVEYENRTFELRHKMGGGPLTWYELCPYIVHRSDCTESS